MPGNDGSLVDDDGVPAVAARVFGDRLPDAIRYARLLATDGVVRGLIGPREADRLWDRHILNCAAVAELIPAGSRVVDAGSGAGLPGVVLALARPDLELVLVDAQARRVEFLTECVSALRLDGVRVLQGRVEDGSVRDGLRPVDVVTARALAPLDRLSLWCLPLLGSGGRLLAIKGSSASDEVTRYRDTLSRYGASKVMVRRCGAGIVQPETTVVDVVVG
jgi:16S rRNA (guanine527-N7)-methyltransferase